MYLLSLSLSLSLTLLVLIPHTITSHPIHPTHLTFKPITPITLHFTRPLSLPYPFCHTLSQHTLKSHTLFLTPHIIPTFSLSPHSLYTHSFRLFRLSLSLPLFLLPLSRPIFSLSTISQSLHSPFSISLLPHSLNYSPTISQYLSSIHFHVIPHLPPSLSLFPLSLIRLFVFLTEISFSQPNLSLSVSLTQAISLTPVLSFSPTLSLIPTLPPNNLLLSLFYFTSFPFFYPTLSLQLQPDSLLLQLHLSLSQSLISTLSFIIVSLSLSLITLTFI